MKEKGFFREAFVTYITENYECDNFATELINRILDYARDYEHIGKDDFVRFVSEMIPGVTFGEVAQFADNDILTAKGIEEKRRWLV